MHPSVSRAFEEIDAAIFSGDTFYDPDALNKLKRMMDRWTRQLPHLEEMSKPSGE